jgi:uncharacterized protein YjbI with pentapeptide repeats
MGDDALPSPPMANEEHLNLLLQGSQPWNEWRSANPEIKPDLRKADLHEMDLKGANLSRAVLIDADLHGARLQGAKLAEANLRRADLHQTDFQSADLHRAILAKTDLRDANLRGADVREADLREARLSGATLEGADLAGAILHKDGFRYVSAHTNRPPATSAGATPAPAAAAPRGLNRKLAVAAGGSLLALALVGLVISRPARQVDARVSQAVSKAVASSAGIDTVFVEGQALTLRSGKEKVESGQYLDLLKTACEALEKLGPTSGLQEIRITNQSGQEGWVYGAPEKCAEILAKPAALTGLSIAAHTKPIRK